MKIQIVSDLHLEFQSNRDWLRKNPILPRADVLLIAGDIICDIYKKKASFFYQKINKDFPLIVSTMGNHEFYHGTYLYAYPQYKRWISANHLHLNNEVYIHGETKFIVSVLWSHIPDYCIAEIEQGLNDYHCIYNNVKAKDRRLIRALDTNLLHQQSLHFIQAELAKPFDGKVVLLTHHLPSYSAISPTYIGSSLNAAFASNLNELIENNPQIALWLCGHSHDRYVTTIGTTLIVRNPLGYVDCNEHRDFKRDFVLEI